LGEFSADLSADYFKANVFGLGSVNTKTFILLLASKQPRSFISGQHVDLANTLKFHHLMPRAFLKANYKGDLSEMPKDVGPVLESAVAPETLFTDDYERFVGERADRLLEAAKALCD
jgi:hypothetical protein